MENKDIIHDISIKALANLSIVCTRDNINEEIIE